MKFLKITEFQADGFDTVQVTTGENFTTVTCRGHVYYVGGGSCVFAIAREKNRMTLYAIAPDND